MTSVADYGPTVRICLQPISRLREKFIAHSEKECACGTHQRRVFWIGGLWRSTQICWRSTVFGKILLVTYRLSRASSSGTRGSNLLPCSWLRPHRITVSVPLKTVSTSSQMPAQICWRSTVLGNFVGPVSPVSSVLSWYSEIRV